MNSSYKLFFCFLLFCATSSFGQSKGKNSKPNILLILVDDLKPTLGVYNDTLAISPNIDSLANSGMRFDHAYANQAVCVASRYNIMLGSRSTSTGLYNFGKDFRKVIPDAVTLPQYFMNAGYHSEAMGKVYHVGHGNTNDEASWSVPHHEEKVIDYILPESTNRELTREEALFENARKYSENLEVRDLPRGAAWESADVLDDAYADGRIANHAIKRLRGLSTNQEKPFFLAVGFARPHLPFSVPKKYWDMYNRNNMPLPEYEIDPEGAPEFAVKRRGEIFNFKPIEAGEDGLFDEDLKRSLIHGYYASVSYMDAQLGKVIEELKSLELDKNTIIVLWGDHGWHLGDHGIWTKHTNYEQATRIPLIIKAPGVSTAGSSSDQPVATVDIYPTLADLAGLERPNGPQPIDGTSLKEILKNPSKEVKDHIYHVYIRNGNLGEAIRTKRYRMVRWTNLKEKTKVEYELYDYEQDPLEKENTASSNPQKVKELVAFLDQYPEAKQ